MFRDMLNAGDEFVVTCELVPGRGFKGRSVDQVLQFAEESKKIGAIHALSLTDNAGGNPALSADVLGVAIQEMGVELIVHFSCKDMNRNMIESRAYALQRLGITDLLVISGDYPLSGYLGLPKPVFDVDSVNALKYLTEMNIGLEIESFRKTVTLSPTDFFLGGVVSPFKWTEGPSIMQYVKMEKKIRCGAHYFITQLGYDYRKLVELVRYTREYLKSDVPLIGSVYVLSAGAARFMNRGEIPGCYVDDKLLATIVAEAKAPDKGKQARLDRASKQVAILKGLGYSGAHIEGLNLKAKDVAQILERADDIGQNWPDHIGDYATAPAKAYYLLKDGEKPEVPDMSKSVEIAKTRRRAILSLNFWITRLIHVALFEPKSLGYKFMLWFSKLIEHKKGLYKLFGAMERLTKRVLFGCRQCDDCALFEMFYVCPESQCPKGMRQGPCGGSRINGHCEVYEERQCIWNRVYWRAKNRRQCTKLRYIISPRDWSLYETSSWVNYYLKRDHSGREIYWPELEEASICDREKVAELK